MPLPEPKEDFRANLLRYGPSGGVEVLPLDEGEGYGNMPGGLLLWECQDPELSFFSHDYMVYLRAHGT